MVQTIRLEEIKKVMESITFQVGGASFRLHNDTLLFDALNRCKAFSTQDCAAE